MDATNALETQDLQIADLVEREGRALVYVLAKWDLVEDPQARLKDLREEADKALPQLRGAPDGGAVGRDRPRARQADAGGAEGAEGLVGRR